MPCRSLQVCHQQTLVQTWAIINLVISWIFWVRSVTFLAYWLLFRSRCNLQGPFNEKSECYLCYSPIITLAVGWKLSHPTFYVSQSASGVGELHEVLAGICVIHVLGSHLTSNVNWFMPGTKCRGWSCWHRTARWGYGWYNPESLHSDTWQHGHHLGFWWPVLHGVQVLFSSCVEINMHCLCLALWCC
jgi:hypothetical protein